MKNSPQLILAVLVIFFSISGFMCNDEAAPAPTATPLNATSTELTMMNSDRMVVKITGGNMPYEIKMNSNPEVTAIQLDGGELTINTTQIGTSTIVIQDVSWPLQRVTIHVSSVAVINVPGKGSLSFSSSVGPFAVVGPMALSQNSPPAKSGAGAVQWNGLTAVIAYRVRAADSIDIVELDLYTPGAYLYPRTLAFATAGNAAIIFFVRGYNPYNASQKVNEYLMMNATAVINTANDSLVAGTFSGTFTNMKNYLDTITVTNAVFSTPIKRVGAPEFDGRMLLRERNQRLSHILTTERWMQVTTAQ